jgi:chaperonin GroEL (HSP60 family)
MSGNVKQVAAADVDERLAALIGNAGAIQAIASAVEGTLGPKGLNCMLVDRFGDVTITNDGSTILDKIDVSHPAARMLIHTAKAQESEVGDGTTTATLLAAAIVQEGVSHVSKGVPVTKIIEGLRAGVYRAIKIMRERSRPLAGLDDPLLLSAATIAGRQNEAIARLVVEAARRVPQARWEDEGFRLADMVLAKEGAESEVVPGLVIDKQRMNRQMPKRVENVRVLVVDDALEPEQIEDDALGTDAGFARYLQLQQEFRDNIAKVVRLGVGLVVVDKGVDDAAEEILTDAGVLVIRRVPSKDLTRIVHHTGARTIKRAGLRKPADELAEFLGEVECAYEDERLEHIRILGGKGEPAATILVGAATGEVKDETARIARDAAWAVQCALADGVLPGGGAIEIWTAGQIADLRESVKGMAAYGVDCLVEALKRPLAQIVANAGFNPLEKVEDVIAAQADQGSDALALNCDTGEVADMVALGVVDPTRVKIHALRAAAEIAEAILRINTIIRKREETRPTAGSAAQAGEGEAPSPLLEAP